MSTGSKTQRNRKKRRGATRTENAGPEPSRRVSSPPEKVRSAPATVEAPVQVPTTEFSQRAWLIACIVILVIAAAARLYDLNLKPMHHDEGVNGFFLTNLVRQGIYKYDPNNYHGPTLYYLALPFVKLFGLNTFAVRFLTVLFGIGTIALVLSLRRYLGTVATISAAALIAVSPGAVFYSRYFIHETLFVFFTLGIVVAALRFYETSSALYFILAAISTGLLFATKETAFVSMGTLGLAWLVAWKWTEYGLGSGKSGQRKRRDKRRAKEAASGMIDMKSLLARSGGRDRVVMLTLYATGVFIVVNVLFFSSFFTNWPGVSGAVQAMKIWAGTGTSEFHGKRFDTYLTWLFQEETPIFLLAVAGSLVALFGSRINRFAIFVGAWAFGLLLAYSLIPYKTPWLMLSFVVPMALVGGYAVQHLSEKSWGTLKAPVPAIVVAGLALAICVYQSAVLNFREYDNEQYPYVYAHSSRELVAMVNEIERIAARAGTKNQTGVTIASPENWPLPWYFRDYPRVGYVGTVADRYDSKDVPIVIGRESTDPKDDQVAKLRTALGPDYEKAGAYKLRPGVLLALFVRRDLVAR